MDIINKFSPIIYFHPEERYFPVSSEFLLNNSTVKDFIDNKTIVKPTNRELYDISKKYDFQEPSKDGAIIMNFNEYIYKGEIPITNVPIYAIKRTINNLIYITYIVLFTYNGDYKILNIKSAGSHPGDIEHITLEIDQNEKLKRIFYAAHGNLDGRIVNESEIEYENGKIVAYCALNGHGFYPHSGYAFRIGGLANDYLAKGLKWEPKVYEIFSRTSPYFNIDTMGWTVYNGRIGGKLEEGNREGIVGLIGKVWYGSEGKNIDEFNESKLSSPKLISEKLGNNLIILKDIVFFIFIYLLSYLVLKINMKLLETKNYSYFSIQVLTITILLFLFYIYRKIAYYLISKYG